MARAIDADRLLLVLEKNFGHTGGAAVMRQLIEIQPPLPQPSNNPLTLEELRGMDGEPVWLNVSDGVWALVDTDDDCVWLDRGGSIDISGLAGKAYRRPPEGEA